MKIMMGVIKVTPIIILQFFHLPESKLHHTFDQTHVACKQTLFYFSFRSVQKHRRARERSERARTSAEREKENLALAVNKSPAVYILSRALDGLWRENWGSVNRLKLMMIEALLISFQNKGTSSIVSHSCSAYIMLVRFKFPSKLSRRIQ